MLPDSFCNCWASDCYVTHEKSRFKTLTKVITTNLSSNKKQFGLFDVLHLDYPRAYNGRETRFAKIYPHAHKSMIGPLVM